MAISMSGAMAGSMSSAMSGAMSSSMAGSMSSSMSGAISSAVSGAKHDNSTLDNNNQFDPLYYQQVVLSGLVLKLSYIVYIICLVGIFGNMCSVLVLIKQGFEKSSNILLFSLAIVDNIYLIATVVNQISEHLQRTTSEISLLPLKITNSLYLFARYCSTTFPVLITVERLVAVLLPLKFNVIVTPWRVWLAVVLDTLLELIRRLTDICQTSESIQFTFREANPSNNSVDGEQTTCQILFPYIELYDLFIAYLEGIFSTSFVTIGCMIIGAKVTYSVKKRSKMTSRKTSQSDRTTITLLSVLAVYIPSGGFYVIYRLVELNTHTFSTLLYFIRNLLFIINSSCNCLIYVITNRNFRQDCRRLFKA